MVRQRLSSAILDKYLRKQIEEYLWGQIGVGFSIWVYVTDFLSYGLHQARIRGLVI